MANLEGMPISALPKLDKLQDGDEAVIYRPSTGKAYQAPDLLQDLEEKIQENTDLIDSLLGDVSFEYASFVQGNSYSVEATMCIAFCACSNNYYAAYMLFNDFVMPIVESENYITASASGGTYTITNGLSTGTVRVLFIKYA